MVIEGAFTAIVTPMRDGEVDYDALSRLCEEQIDAGIDGLVPVGTTGESATLSVPEHVEVIKHTIKAAAGRVPVIAGAGGNSTREAIVLSKESEKAGAEGLLHVAPYYNKPTQEGLYQHFKAIAESTELPIVLYNVPGRTSSDIQNDTVLRLSDIDNIVAIKDATADMRRAGDLLRRVDPSFAVLSGDDFTALTLWALGGRGCISVISNAMPDRMAKMWDAVCSNDWDAARKLHYSMLPLCELLFAEGNPIGIKETMHILGKITPELRLPMTRASESLQQRLRDCLSAEGML